MRENSARGVYGSTLDRFATPFVLAAPLMDKKISSLTAPRRKAIIPRIGALRRDESRSAEILLESHGSRAIQNRRGRLVAGHYGAENRGVRRQCDGAQPVAIGNGA